MIKKTICILLLIGAVAAVTFSALNSSKSQSQLMRYIEQSQAAPEQSEAVTPCDTIPCDSLPQSNQCGYVNNQRPICHYK